MNMSISNWTRRVWTVVIGFAMLLTACNPEPDESDLYTFTGETIESFIKKDSLLTDFNYMCRLRPRTRCIRYVHMLRTNQCRGKGIL